MTAVPSPRCMKTARSSIFVGFQKAFCAGAQEFAPLEPPRAPHAARQPHRSAALQGESGAGRSGHALPEGREYG